MTKDEQSDLAQSYELLKQEGFSVEWLDPVAIGMKKPCSALLNRSDGSMNPVKFWTRVAEGLPVQSHCEVLSVTHQKDFLAVETTTGNFKARRVVYCLNAFAESLLPVMKGRYIPLRGQIIELPLLGKSPTERPIYAKYGDLYWRFTTNSLIFGGLEDAVPDQEVGIAKEVSTQILDAQVRWIQENFEDHLIEFSPQTWKTRCSTMAFTVDGFPFVGPVAEKDCYVLSGLCGLGHGYAMECASWLYDLIELGINKIPAYISSDRMNTLPVYTGGDWRNLYEAWNHGIH